MIAVRPWAEVVADLRQIERHYEGFAQRTAREAADAGDALAARVAAVQAALDQYEKERPRAIAIYDCVSAIAKAVGR